MNNICVGIDLGTSNSAVAYLNKDGRPEIIPNREGGRLTPSVFAVAEDGTRLVGSTAVEQEPTNAVNTVRSVKRLMGQVGADGRPARLVVAGKEYSPEEISAEILRKLKEDAEAHLGHEVTQAVVTVPAYFNDGQRTATKLAGQLAGLEVLRVINEPTAAALAYGIERKENERILVYDLGGGTFDVTLLEIAHDEGALDFAVKATGGDTRLGGDDFDEEIVRMIRAAVPPSAVLDVTAEKRIRSAAESLKKQLTAAKSGRATIPHLTTVDGKPYTLNFTLDREDFEHAIQGLIDRTKRIVEGAMGDAGWTNRTLDEVVFVGGSTRVPAVFAAVEKWTEREPNRSINPDEAVAVGAAVQAALLTHQSKEDIVLFDVTPLTLGIETVGGEFVRMIRRNQRIPYSKTHTFGANEDGQTQAEIRVYQGERSIARHNMPVGRFHLTGIPARPKEETEIEVTYSIDANGILSVKAVDVKTGTDAEVVMTGSSSLTSEEVARLLEDAEQNRAADEKEIQRRRTHERLQKRLAQVRSILSTSRAVVGDELATELEDAAAAIEDALGTAHAEYMEQSDKAAKKSVEDATKKIREHADQLIKGMGDLEA